MTDRQALGRLIGERCRLQGEFTLRSGQVSSTYFDKYLFESDPVLLGEVAREAAELIPEGTEFLAGLELGGIPVVTALSLVTGLPAVFVRKQAKDYGTAKLAEGGAIGGRKTLVVEDVITTGGQAAMSVGDLRARGAMVDTVLCIIDRSQGVHPEIVALGCSVVSVFTADNLG